MRSMTLLLDNAVKFTATLVLQTSVAASPVIVAWRLATWPEPPELVITNFSDVDALSLSAVSAAVVPVAVMLCVHDVRSNSKLGFVM